MEGVRGGFGKGRKVPEILCVKGRERRKKKSEPPGWVCETRLVIGVQVVVVVDRLPYSWSLEKGSVPCGCLNLVSW